MADPARARRIADRIQELIARNVQSTLKDPRLGFFTVTDVRVTNDLQQATVFYSVMGDDAARQDAAEALAEGRGKLRSMVGKGLGIRLTPSLEFVLDALPESAAHLEDVLRRTKERDAELASQAAKAQYAGDADPYRHPGEHDDLDDDVNDDADGSER